LQSIFSRLSFYRPIMTGRKGPPMRRPFSIQCPYQAGGFNPGEFVHPNSVSGRMRPPTGGLLVERPQQPMGAWEGRRWGHLPARVARSGQVSIHQMNRATATIAIGQSPNTTMPARTITSDMTRALQWDAQNTPRRKPRKVQFVPVFPRPSIIRHRGKGRAKAESFRHQN
jgi:hypothetical protein